jgi:hypothetical protein
MIRRLLQPHTKPATLVGGYTVGRQLVCLLLLVCLLPVLAIPGSALAQGEEGALIVAAGERVAGSLTTVSRDIQVDGTVDGDVTSWSGDITIAGTVGGDVVTYGGTVVITSSGHVAGHILASGGGLQQKPGASVDGQAIGEFGGSPVASLIDLFISAPDADALGPVGRALFAGVVGVLLAASSLLCVAFWPRRILIASTTLRRLPGRAIALGLLATVALALAAAPLAGLLVASVIGLPLLLVLLAAALVPYVYGLVVLAHTAGVRLRGLPARAGSVDSRVVLVVLVLVLAVVLAVAVAPAWSLVLFYLLASPGLGAVMLSRGGLVVPLVVSTRSG